MNEWEIEREARMQENEVLEAGEVEGCLADNTHGNDVIEDSCLVADTLEEGARHLQRLSGVAKTARSTNDGIYPVENERSILSDDGSEQKGASLASEKVRSAGWAREDAVGKFAIVGRPNVGKSSLLNRLLGEERAVVDPQAGTTRDTIAAEYKWRDHQLLLVDTAGIRKPQVCLSTGPRPK